MKLIAILVTMAVDHLLGDVLGKFKELRRLNWFHGLAAFLEKTFGAIAVWNGPVGVLVTVALPIVVFWLVGAFLGGISGIGGVLAFLFSIAVLLYSLGPTDLSTELGPIVQAIGENNDEETSRRVQELAKSAEPILATSRARAAVESIMVQANERVFAVLCWFAVLGWVGALVFRFASELRLYAPKARPGFGGFAQRLYDILVWLPARLTALAYALGGNFAGAFKSWRVKDTLGLQQSDQVLKDSGLGALQFETGTGGDAERINGAQDLVNRSLLVWLAGLVLMFVIAWIV